MSLGIVFKGAEGIVLAADSRVTLTKTIQQSATQTLAVPATFDNATKLLRVKGQDFVGAVTYGVGAIGQGAPRTAHSFLPELEADIQNAHGSRRLTVLQFTTHMAQFFLGQWKNLMKGTAEPGNDMTFLVGGYDEGESYGQTYEIKIPSAPEPHEHLPLDFGLNWGGQTEIGEALLLGCGRNTGRTIAEALRLDAEKGDLLTQVLDRFRAEIPYRFLPLQDCVDLAIFIIQATIKMQSWTTGVRGVGGAIDVATITKAEGFVPVQMKGIAGESRGKQSIRNPHRGIRLQ